MTADIQTLSAVGVIAWVAGNGTPWLLDKTFGPMVEDRLGGFWRRREHRTPLAERLFEELNKIDIEGRALTVLLEQMIDQRDHAQHDLARCRRQLAEAQRQLAQLQVELADVRRTAGAQTGSLAAKRRRKGSAVPRSRPAPATRNA